MTSPSFEFAPRKMKLWLHQVRGLPHPHLRADPHCAGSVAIGKASGVGVSVGSSERPEEQKVQIGESHHLAQPGWHPQQVLIHSDSRQTLSWVLGPSREFWALVGNYSIMGEIDVRVCVCVRACWSVMIWGNSRSTWAHGGGRD